MNTFAGGKILDWIIIHSCISLHVNPTSERVTVDAQQYNMKQNLATQNLQTLLFPADIITVMSDKK